MLLSGLFTFKRFPGRNLSQGQIIAGLKALEFSTCLQIQFIKLIMLLISEEILRGNMNNLF